MNTVRLILKKLNLPAATLNVKTTAKANAATTVKTSNFTTSANPVRMSCYSEEHIRGKLVKELDATFVEVVDESDGCGGKFSCTIVSSKFEGKPLLQRHRLVNSVLQEELKSIHAFSQKTLTPQQWEAEKKN